MSRSYKNQVLHDHVSTGVTRRKALAQEVLRDAAPFPQTISYEDIDKEFKRWVEEELRISYEDKDLPTMVLYSNQKFSEYRQSWEFNDEKHNLILNFKTISREINPKHGEIYGQSRNVPGDRRYTMKRILTEDDSGRQFYTVLKMKQPFSVDLSYKVSIFTNKIELINKFNELVLDKFKAIDCYLRPNGHFMAMKLEEVSDNSEFSIDDREFYAQTFDIKLMAYIISNDSYEIYEEPILKFNGIDTKFDNDRSLVEIEDYDDGNSVITIKMYKDSESRTKFTTDSAIFVTGMTVTNINSFKLEIDGQEIETHVINDRVYNSMHYDKNGVPCNEVFMEFPIHKDSEVRVKKVNFGFNGRVGQINIEGKFLQKE